MIDSLFSNQTYVAAKQMLDASALRQKAIASNIANAETPGYKRIDLRKSFESELASSLKSGQAETAAPTLEVDSTAPSTSKDGNTVAIDREMLAMSSNSSDFEAMTELVSGSIRQLRVAVTGRSA